MTRSPERPFAEWPCLRIETDGSTQCAVLDISASPNAKKTELVGWHDGALRVRLAAAPVEGAANEALRKWLAKELGTTVAKVALLRGATGRRKQWRLHIDPQQVVAWLASQPTLQN